MSCPRSWQVSWDSFSWWPFESLYLSLSFSLFMSDCFSSSSRGQSFCHCVFFFCLIFPLICLHWRAFRRVCLMFFSSPVSLSGLISVKALAARRPISKGDSDTFCWHWAVDFLFPKASSVNKQQTSLWFYLQNAI